MIEGFHAEVNLDAIGRPVQALIHVRLHPKIREAVEGFRDYVAALPETLAVFVVSGGDDFIIQVAVRDTTHLRDFVLDHVARHRNIADVRTSLGLRPHPQDLRRGAASRTRRQTAHRPQVPLKPGSDRLAHRSQAPLRPGSDRRAELGRRPSRWGQAPSSLRTRSAPTASSSVGSRGPVSRPTSSR